MRCARPSKSSTERPARSGSRAPVPCHAVCTSLSVSGRYEIAYRDSDGRLRIETVADTLEEAKAAPAEIVREEQQCGFGRVDNRGNAGLVRRELMRTGKAEKSR